MPVQAPYPDGQVTAGMHLSHDGSRLVVPTMDAQAFDVAPGKIDAYVREHHLSSYLRVFDISTGEKVLCEKVPAWISHVQFSPDVALDRQGTPSTAHGGREPQQGRLDRHEMWERDGKSIIYHGTYVDGRAHLGRVKRTAIPARKAVERGFRCSTSTAMPDIRQRFSWIASARHACHRHHHAALRIVAVLRCSRQCRARTHTKGRLLGTPGAGHPRCRSSRWAGQQARLVRSAVANQRFLARRSRAPAKDGLVRP